MLWNFWWTKMHHEIAETLVALLKICVFWRMIMRTSEWPIPRSPRGGECLGTNVVFMSAAQDSVFHFSRSFVFPPIFT